MDLNEEFFSLDEAELPRRRQARKLRYYMIAFTVAVISVYGAFFRGITWKNTSLGKRDPVQEFNLSNTQSSVPLYDDNVADDGTDELCKFLKNSTIPAEAAKLFFHNENRELPAHSAEAILTKMMIAGWFAVHAESFSSLITSNLTHLHSQLFLQIDAALEREGFKAPAFLYYDAVVTQLEDIKQFPTRRFTNKTACSTAYATLLTKIRPLPTNKMFEYFTVAKEVSNLIEGKAVVLILGITKAGKSLLSHILGESPILQFINHLGNVVYFPNMSAITNTGLLNVSVGTGIQSTTKYINAFQVKDYVQWFLDFAGFLDGRSADQDIANGQVGVEVLLKAKEISPVLVINGASMSYSFTNIASILVQLFPNLEEDSKSFIYIFNRINDCKMCSNASMYQSSIHNYFSERRDFLGTSELTNPGFLSLIDDIIEKTRCDGKGWKYAIYFDVEYKDLGREQILEAISKIPPIQVSSNRIHHFIGDSSKTSLGAEQNVQLHSMSHMMQFPFQLLSNEDIQLISYRLNVLRKLAENLTFDESKLAYARGISTIQSPINILKQEFTLSFANHFSTLNFPTDFTKLCKDFQSFITLNKQLTEELNIHAKHLKLPSKEQLLSIVEENIRTELQKHLNKFNNLDDLEKGIFKSIKVLLDFSSIAASNIDGYATFHEVFVQKVENHLFAIAKHSKENTLEETKTYFEQAVESWDISRIAHSLDLMQWGCEALSTYFPSVQFAYSTSKSSFEVKFTNYAKYGASILTNSQKINHVTVENISPTLRALKSALSENRLKPHFNEYLTNISKTILLGAVTEFSNNNSVLLNTAIHSDQESELVQSLYNNSKILSTNLSSLFADELIKQSLSEAYRFDSDLVGNFAKRLALSIESLVHSLFNDSSETSVSTLEKLFKTYDSCDWIKEIRPVEYQMIEDAIGKIITGYQSLKKEVTDFMLGISIPEQLTIIRIWTNNLQMAKIIFNLSMATAEPIMISSSRASPRSDILKSINETEQVIVEKRMKVLNGIASSISNLSFDFQRTSDFVKLMNRENSHSARLYLQESIKLRLYELSENSTRELHNQFISDYSTAIKNQFDFVFNIIKTYQDGTAEKNEPVLNNIGNLLKSRLDELKEYQNLTEFNEFYSSLDKRIFDLKEELGKTDSGLLKSDISEYTTVFNISAALLPLDSHFQHQTNFSGLKEKSRTNFDSADSELATSIIAAIKNKKIHEVNDLLVKSKDSGLEKVYKRHCNHLIEFFEEELLLLEKRVEDENILFMKANEISTQIVSLNINMQITQLHISKMAWSQYGAAFRRIFTKIRGKVESFSNIERPLSSRQYSLIDQTLKKLKNMHNSLQNAKEAFAKYLAANDSILDFLKEKIEVITSQTLLKLNQNIEYFQDLEFDRWIYTSKEVYDQIKESDYFSEFLSYIEGNVTETVLRRINDTLNNAKTTADQKIQELNSLKSVIKNDFPQPVSNNCDRILCNEVKKLSDDKSDLENSLELNWKIIEENLKLNVAYETEGDREKTMIDELAKIRKINPSKFSTYCQNIIDKCDLSSQKISNSLRKMDDLHSFIYSIHFFDRFHLHNFALLDWRFKNQYNNFISQTRDIIKGIVKWNNSQLSPVSAEFVSKKLKRLYYGYDFLSQINYHFPTSYQLIEDENFKNVMSNLKKKLLHFFEQKKSILQSAINNLDANGVFEIFQYLKNNDKILKKFISLSASSSTSSTDFLLEGFERIYLLDHAKTMLSQSIESFNGVLSQNINDLRSSTNNHGMRRGLMEDIEKRLSFYRKLSELFLEEANASKGDETDESNSESGSDGSGPTDYGLLTAYTRFIEIFRKDIVDPSLLEIKTLMDKLQQKNHFIERNHDDDANRHEELLSLVEKEKFDQNYDHILLIQKLFGTSPTPSSSELFSEISTLIEDNDRFFNDKIDQIAKDFTDKQDAMNRLRAAGGSTLESQEYIEQLVEYLIQFDDIRQLHSTFHDRIDQKIKELLDNKLNPRLREEDIFDIGTVLAQSPNGFDIAKRESALFDASWNVLRKKDTEAMDLPRALDFLSKHASNINTQRLEIFYKSYEKRYKMIIDSARISLEKENNNNVKQNIIQYIKTKINPEIKRIKRSIIVSQNKGEKFVFWYPQTRTAAIEMIPYMMAINTLRSSRLTWQPHVTQVLSMLIMFGADKEDSYFNRVSRWFRGDVPVLMNHLLQILTGQGKSIILSSTAAIFAELGYDVYISCYSRYLSDRDKMQFQDFFELLEIDANQHVVYNTLHNLVERMINNDGNFRDQIIRAIKGQELINIANVTNNSSNHNNRPKILLLDEVDILLTPSFFVDPYNLSVPLRHSSISDLMEFIWKEGKSKGVSLLDIKSSVPYQSCISTFPRWKFLFEIAIEEMLLGMKNVMNGTYHGAVFDETTKTFGYKLNDEISFKFNYGYETLFLYFKQAEGDLSVNSNVKLTFQEAKEKSYISVNGGSFLYRELVKEFHGIFGVTGSLESLLPEQLTALRTLLSVPEESGITYIPSAYENREKRFCFNPTKKNSTDFQIIPRLTDYYQAILDEIFNRSTALRPPFCSQDEKKYNTSDDNDIDPKWNHRKHLKRPVLIFINSQDELFKLHHYTKDQLTKAGFFINIMLENDDLGEREKKIRNAVKPGTITFAVEVYGRGTDFVHRNNDLNAIGGIHVLQVFFSSDFSHQIQTMGRTARDNNIGSYSLVVFRDDLVNNFNLSDSVNELMTSPQSEQYQKLFDFRTQFVGKQFQQYDTLRLNKIDMHKRAVNLLSYNEQEIMDYLTSCILRTKSVRTNYFFVLDRSGSMEKDKERAVKKCMHYFYSQVINQYDEIGIVVFDNIWLPTHLPLVVNNEKNHPAIAQSLQSLPPARGGTNLRDAVQHGYNEFTAHIAKESATVSSHPSITANVDNWIIILTDGGDTGSRVSHSEILQTIGKNQNIGIVLFGIGCTDAEEKVLKEMRDAGPVGRRHYFSGTGDEAGIQQVFNNMTKALQIRGEFAG